MASKFPELLPEMRRHIVSQLLGFLNEKDMSCSNLLQFCSEVDHETKYLCDELSMYRNFSLKKKWPVIASDRKEFIKLCALFKDINFQQIEDSSAESLIVTLIGFYRDSERRRSIERRKSITLKKGMSVDELRAYALPLIKERVFQSNKKGLFRVRLAFPWACKNIDLPFESLKSLPPERRQIHVVYNDD